MNKGSHHSIESKKKMSIALRGEKHPFFGKKHTKETKTLIGLKGKGNKHTLGKHWKLSEQAKTNISNGHQGNKHWNWKGGLAFRKKKDERNDSAYIAWSKKVKIRDGWRCVLFNKKCQGSVVAHHILSWGEYPDRRYELDNGITLCQYHHPRKRIDEKRLVKKFQKIIYRNE